MRNPVGGRAYIVNNNEWLPLGEVQQFEYRTDEVLGREQRFIRIDTVGNASDMDGPLPSQDRRNIAWLESELGRVTT